MEPLTDSPSWAAGHRDSAGKRVDHALGSRREAMAEADAGVEIAENLAAFWGSGATLVCSRGWLFCGTRLQTLATVYDAMPHRMLIIVQDPNAAATLVRIAVGTGDLQGADGYRGTRRPPRARRRTGRHDRRHRRPRRDTTPGRAGPHRGGHRGLGGVRHPPRTAAPPVAHFWYNLLLRIDLIAAAKLVIVLCHRSRLRRPRVGKLARSGRR
jgi:hypothetical protein